MQITETIIHSNQSNPFKWEDLQKYSDILLPDDVIECRFEEAYTSENESLEAHYILRVTRIREMTLEEKEKYKREKLENEERLKDLRYQRYLKLKAEFNDDQTNSNRS